MEYIEIWKDIESFEGQYQVSNLGNVRSLNYRRTGRIEILTPMKERNGYEYVNLCRSPKDHERHKVHRLVATAFVDNPNGYNEVDHKNTITNDNRAENLRWVNHTMNMSNPITLNKKRNNDKIAVKVVQYSLDGEYIKEWNSIKEAGIELKKIYPKINTGNISSCCRGRFKSAYGYIWRYKEEVS